MYTNYKLQENPSFRMIGAEFNKLLNTMTPDKGKDTDKPVKLGITIRTKTTNLVAKKDTSLLLETETLPKFGGGFFNIVSTAQNLLINTFGNIDFDVISKTVFLPVGAFEHEGNIFVYCHLIVEDEHTEAFSTNDSINFLPIEENTLNNLDNKSIMVISTLSIVR